MIFVLAAGLAGQAGAEAGRLSASFWVLDQRARQRSGPSIDISPPAIIVPGAPLAGYRGSYRGPYLAVARDAARRHDVPEALFVRLVAHESRWNPRAVSPKGAIGLAQLMPDTAARLGVDPTAPDQALEGGARYLRGLYDRFGTWPLALAAYNAGPEAVQRYGGVPPYPETEGYVAAIWGG